MNFATSCLRMPKVLQAVQWSIARGSKVVQLTPQLRDRITPEVAETLRSLHPDVELRLHANAPVLPERVIADLSGLNIHVVNFGELGRINRILGASCYSAHAGRRREASLAQMFDNARRLSDAWGVPVAVEGHYPTVTRTYLVDNWREYIQLFESGLPYALDLSHINIVARASGEQRIDVLRSAISSPLCLEVHVSDNDGTKDSHRKIEGTTWWTPLLECLGPNVTLLTEEMLQA